MATYYEIVAQGPDGQKRRVCYSARKSMRGLTAALQSNASRILGATGLPAKTPFQPVTKLRIHGYMAGDWVFYFSGRTEREAQQTGALRGLLDVGGAFDGKVVTSDADQGL